MYCFFYRKLSEISHFHLFRAENQNVRLLKTMKQVHTSATLKQLLLFLYTFFQVLLNT